MLSRKIKRDLAFLLKESFKVHEQLLGMHNHIQSYLESFDLKDLLIELKINGIDKYLDQAKHFSLKEAHDRDKLLLEYLGKRGIERIVNSVLESLVLVSNTELLDILDVGAGTGLLTEKIMDKIRSRVPNASFFAMDLTPDMLKILASKRKDVIPIVGIVERIRDSVLYSSRYFALPDKFDVIISILTLHHVKDVEKALSSLKESVKPNGCVIIIDLCKHEFEEFKEEMADIHLGFDPAEFQKLAVKYFPKILIERIQGICCESSGRSVDLFKAVLMP
jgi:SAM-dependent methyltransferase